MYLAQGHDTATRVGIEPPTSRSGIRRSTTRPRRLPLSCLLDQCLIGGLEVALISMSGKSLTKSTGGQSNFTLCHIVLLSVRQIEGGGYVII